MRCFGWSPWCFRPMVNMEDGSMIGCTGRDIDGKKFLKFKGIPYAQYTKGPLRLRDPRPPGLWLRLFDNHEGKAFGCYGQDPFYPNEVSGGETCLFLNVYTRKLPRRKTDPLKPVFFCIPGVDFTYACSDETYHGAEFFMTQNLVLVTVSYRVGLLGFSSFEDYDIGVPGNAGLKDLVMALRWVRKNISTFGGDPDNVTVFGQDSGAACAHLLMLSPMADGLLHKVIAQSGCALNPWVSRPSGHQQIIQHLLPTFDDPQPSTVYHALATLPREEILKAQKSMYKDISANKPRPIGVVAEVDSDTPFLDKDPIEILESGNYKAVPLMIGYTKTEGMHVVHPKRDRPFNFTDYLPWNFGYLRNTSAEEEAVGELRQFYTKNKNLITHREEIECEIASDSLYRHGIHLTVLLSKGDTYLYRISAETDLNFYKAVHRLRVPGVSHFDDIGYLFKTRCTSKIPPRGTRRAYINKFLKLWTDFARTGNPTPESISNDPEKPVFWKKIDKELHFLDIGKELKVGVNPDIVNMAFWQNFYDKSPAGVRARSTPGSSTNRRYLQSRKTQESSRS